MPYDLYGQYYASRRDAENAEMAQCAAIDADIAMREVDKMKREQRYQPNPSQLDNEIHELKQKVDYLEERIKKLESLLIP